MKNLKLGVIGCANVAERHMIPAIKAMSGLELVAVASRTKEKAELYAQKNGLVFLEGKEIVKAWQKWSK